MDARTGLPVVGMVGAEHLARLTHQAAISLGQSLRVLAGSADDAAALVAADVVVGDCRSLDDLRAFAAGCDVVTSVDGHVPTEHLETLAADGVAVHPGPDALRWLRDEALLRSRLIDLGIAVPAPGRPVPVTRELVAVVARSPYGQGAAWPVAETVRADGVCREVLASAAGLPEGLADEAQQIALRTAAELGVTGVLVVGLLETTSGRLLVDHVVLGPHTSGNWTIEGARTSQYEQHLRAVLDYPLGATTPTAPAVVTVTLYAGPDDVEPEGIDERVHHCMAHWPDVKIHLYAQSARAGREVGHVTALGADVDEVHQRAVTAAHYLTHGGRL